jgi:hypothetical protein
MHLEISTPKPADLLNSIKSGIDNRNIVTWRYDDAGDFTHVTNDKQWDGKAWLRPEIGNALLSFTILKPEGANNLTPAIRGVYFGRFVEMLLTHFKVDFPKATIVT